MASGKHQFDIEALEIGAKNRIEAISTDILSLGKKDTEATFKLAALLFEASELIGDDKICDSWLISRLGFTARHGRNLRAVHRNLKRYKPDCIRLGVAPTNLYKLAHTEAENIDAVLQLYEDGKRPLGQDVSEILKGKADAQKVDQAIEDSATLKGLAKYAAYEQRLRISRLRDLLAHVLKHVVEAYEPQQRGKAVVKSHLREHIRLQAEEANQLLKIIIGCLQREGHWQAAIGHLRLENPQNDGGWAKLIELLAGLQYLENVPSKELPEFLNGSAIPQLQWALGLKDKEVAALFEKAAENNAPKSTKAAKKKTPAKPNSRKADARSSQARSQKDQQSAKTKREAADSPDLKIAIEEAA